MTTLTYSPDTATEAFTRWFDGSKVTDGAGNPILYYHGTSRTFRAFSLDHFGQTDRGYYGRGFYFTSCAETAATYGHIVLPVYLRVVSPFILLDSGVGGHPSLLSLRDNLARLKGLPPGIRPNRTLPPGFEIRSIERENRYDHSSPLKLFYVAAGPALWGTRAESYGPEKASPEEAIVAFNDERAGNTYHDAGWASSLLKMINRDHLRDVLIANGHDGIFVTDPQFGRGEVVAFHPQQIKHAFENSGTYSLTSPDIFT